MEAYERERPTRLEALLEAEARRAYEEELPPGGEDGALTHLHPQCVKDIGRADYHVGQETFAQGEMGKDPAARKSQFAECLAEECRGCSDAAAGELDPCFLRAVSALASQISMAHVGTLCFSGPHTYAFSGGQSKVHYSIKRQEGQLHADIGRRAWGFTAFSLPDGDAHECHSMSGIRQTARFTVCRAEGELTVRVVEASEELRIVWPNELVVVHDGLALDLRSPQPPWSLLGILWAAVMFFVRYVEKLIWPCLVPLKAVVLLLMRPLLGDKTTHAE